MTALSPYESSPVEGEAPDLELTDPTPVAARRAVTQLIAAQLGEREAEGLVGAVSEVVTNASLYGRPPVRLLGWRRDACVTVTITDRGDGPADADVGLQPAARKVGDGGLGLWLARQMCRELVFGRRTDGFTVRLVAGT